jgi:hypothetical protein
VTLRALEGEPLRDEGVRSIVVSTAHAIAERTGVHLVDIHAEPDHVELTLEADRIAAIGFAAELRRVTTAWWTKRTGASTLWGEAPRDEAD